MIVLLGSLMPSGFAAEGANPSNAGNQIGNYIVIFQPGFARSNSNKLVKDSGGQVLTEYTNVFNGALVSGPQGKMQALAKNPNVRLVEADAEVTASGVQTPTPSWGLDRIDQTDLPLDNQYDFGASSNDQGFGVNVYVIDTGIDKSRTDIGSRVLSGFTSIKDKYGTSDCNGHGTHVSGTIGGTTYGVAKQVNLVPVRVLDCRGSGTNSSVIAGVDWILSANNPNQKDKAVANMSLGGGASAALDTSVANLIAGGVSVAVAAGNSNADACNYSPARVPDAITVGATDKTDLRASYSNFGSCLDIFAPGTNITSLWIGRSQTNTISGTSMATPHVTGAIARYLSKQTSTLSPSQVRDYLVGKASDGLVKDAKGSPNKLLYTK